MKAKNLRKISNKVEDKIFRTVTEVIPYLKKYAKLGFTNASPSVAYSRRYILARALERQGYRVYVSDRGQWIDVEW